MKFFERMFPSKENEEIKNLHKDFKITRDGFWYQNREFDPVLDHELTMKAKVFFEDPALFDNCRFMAKIGKNENETINLPYIGFGYGGEKDREALKEWAMRFPDAELIVGLDNEGVMKDDSEVIKLRSIFS